MGIRLPVLADISTSGAQYKPAQPIPIDSIFSITPLDTSYAPKLASDWVHKRLKEDVWLVDVIRNRSEGPKKIVGELRNAYEDRIADGCARPGYLSISENPNVYCLDTTVSMENIISSRKLPYTVFCLRFSWEMRHT